MDAIVGLDTLGRGIFIAYSARRNASRINMLNNSGVVAGLLLLLQNVS